MVRNLRTALAGSLDVVFESGVIERPAEIYGWSPASATILSQAVRTSTASAGGAALPNSLLTRSVDQAGRKSETTLGIACLHFEIGAFPGAAPDQFELPAGAADAGHRTCGLTPVGSCS